MKTVDSLFYSLPSCGSDTVTKATDSYENPNLEAENMDSAFTASTNGVEEYKPKRKKIFKKIIKFFKEVVRPVLTFIPLFINACANYKRVMSPAC